jgi:hypothetical protein
MIHPATSAPEAGLAAKDPLGLLRPGAAPSGTRERPLRARLHHYRVLDGVRTLRDSELEAVFNRAREEGVLETVMYDVDTTQWTGRTFVNFFKSETRVLWLAFYDEKLAGWVWLDDFGHRAARVHFGFFKWLSRDKLTVQAAREMLWILLNVRFNGARLQVIRGETPSFNKLALRFLNRVGLKVIGEIPAGSYRWQDNTPCAMTFSYVDREMLRPDFEIGTASDGVPAGAAASPALPAAPQQTAGVEA